MPLIVTKAHQPPTCQRQAPADTDGMIHTQVIGDRRPWWWRLFADGVESRHRTEPGASRAEKAAPGNPVLVAHIQPAAGGDGSSVSSALHAEFSPEHCGRRRRGTADRAVRTKPPTTATGGGFFVIPFRKLPQSPPVAAAAAAAAATASHAPDGRAHD